VGDADYDQTRTLLEDGTALAVQCRFDEQSRSDVRDGRTRVVFGLAVKIGNLVIDVAGTLKIEHL